MNHKAVSRVASHYIIQKLQTVHDLNFASLSCFPCRHSLSLVLCSCSWNCPIILFITWFSTLTHATVFCLGLVLGSNALPTLSPVIFFPLFISVQEVVTSGFYSSISETIWGALRSQKYMHLFSNITMATVIFFICLPLISFVCYIQYL